jgi:hypothetical protein
LFAATCVVDGVVVVVTGSAAATVGSAVNVPGAVPGSDWVAGAFTSADVSGAVSGAVVGSDWVAGAVTSADVSGVVPGAVVGFDGGRGAVALFVVVLIARELACVFFAGALDATKCAAVLLALVLDVFEAGGLFVLLPAAGGAARVCNCAGFGFASFVLCCFAAVDDDDVSVAVCAAALMLQLSMPLLTTGGSTWTKLPVNPIAPLVPTCMAWCR